MTATSKNGFKFFTYRSDVIAKNYFTINKKVNFPPHNEITLVVAHDLKPIESIINRLNSQLLIIFSITVIFFRLNFIFYADKNGIYPNGAGNPKTNCRSQVGAW
jgi:hypothetical protein